MIRFILIFLLLPLSALAQEAPDEPPMTMSRMAEIVLRLDPDARLGLNGFDFHVGDVPVLIVADPGADRMRAMVPIASAAGVSDEELRRMMQANFDSALDARYAIAQGRIWSVFIHPLSPLKRDQLISGIGQTVNAAQTYGGLYTGGALQFGGGDSGALQRDLIDDLLERGQEL